MQRRQLDCGGIILYTACKWIVWGFLGLAIVQRRQIDCGGLPDVPYYQVTSSIFAALLAGGVESAQAKN